MRKEIFFVDNSISDEKRKNDFVKLCKFLLEKNEKMNLTAIRTEEEVFEKHFDDSLKGKEYFTVEKKIIEIGSGAGFPSIPLKINERALDFTLVEATGKKCSYLEEVKKIQNFDKCNIINARAEDLPAKGYREKFDVVTARAVAPLNVLCELSMPLIKKGGIAVFYKKKSDEELNLAKNAIKVTGGKIKEIKEYKLPSSSEERIILVIEKERETPFIYPREYKKIIKTPL